MQCIEGEPPFTILDFGCGPGRDLKVFAELGHVAVGLEGAAHFAAMAHAHTGCEIWQKDFLKLDLPDHRFDGVFANASLFHVPSRELPRVLLELHASLKPRGVLFSSNPHGNNEEWLALPASAVTGIGLGLIFGLPSLRLRGLYLAVSTLALHFIVIYLGGEYETKRGFSTGILVDPPSLLGWKLTGGRAWYFVLLVFAAGTLLCCTNLLRSRSGRAFRAIQARESVAEALGIGIAQYKLLAFVISSGMTAVSGCLFAYYRGFVSIEAFDLFLSIQYVAMIIVGGMGSLLGALLGAAFVTAFPYGIEALLKFLPNARAFAGDIFAVNYAAFGVVMILFLVFEPLGLVGIWRRVQNYFLLWPFKYRPIAGAGK